MTDPASVAQELRSERDTLQQQLTHCQVTLYEQGQALTKAQAHNETFSAQISRLETELQQLLTDKQECSKRHAQELEEAQTQSSQAEISAEKYRQESIK